MRVKKFTGKTIQEAVEGLRLEFGRDAVVLHTTQRRRWLWGRIGPKRYEIHGAIDPNFEQSSKPVAKSETAKPLDAEKVDPSWSEAIQTLYGRLMCCDIPKDLSQQLLKEVLAKLPKDAWDDEARIWDSLDGVIAKRIVTASPWEFTGKQKIVVLVGPTGVGKTTTVAKLAANFALISDKDVGLITVDTYRIAAVEQLKTYAEIIGIPVHVAYNPRQLREGIDKMASRDLILIDTAGRSHNNFLQIAELKSYLEEIDNPETHLVVSATTKSRDVDEIVKAFGQLPIDRVIVTKLDETSAHGVILHACERVNAPLAFVTTGQGVPEDIDVANSESLAELILGVGSI